MGVTKSELCHMYDFCSGEIQKLNIRNIEKKAYLCMILMYHLCMIFVMDKHKS